ncbi:MAG: DUF3570 domain-containing protein [bacterium]|nr:DUF3570 domain-containing protein [bacterium]
MTDLRHNNRKARRRAKRGRKRTVLASLSSAAAALLGGAQSSLAEGPIEKVSGAYAFSFYSEDSISRDKTSIGERARYEIKTHQVTFEAPVGERADVGVDFIYETMSGATPWWVEPAADGGNPVQAMSGASVSEKRYDGTLRGNYYFDNARAGGYFGVSGEKDYLAVYAGTSGEYHINQKNTTLSGGLGFSIDEIEPTDAEKFGRAKKKDKESVSLTGGVSQIIDRSTTIQSSISYKHSRGFLSDPYKRAHINALGGFRVADNRPDDRNQMSWLTQLRRHFEPMNASAHLDYRFHYGDWEITSHTFELSWFQNFFDDRIQVIPEFRYYSQSQAYFYEPFYASERSDGLASSDYRLSPYGSFTFGTRVQMRLPELFGRLDARLALSYERQLADDDFALSKVKVPNPGLTDYHLVYLTLDGRF